MQNEDDMIRQFQLIDNEMNAFYNATVEECTNLRGANRKEFLLQQLQKLKDKVQEIETRALSVYSQRTAEIEEGEVQAEALQQIRSAELGLKSIQMCCSALIDGFMHEFDLLK